MSRRRRARILLVLGLVALASMWGGPAGADDIAGEVQRVGWWTNRLGAQPTIAPAQLEVSFGTDKAPTSVAAIDVSVPAVRVQTLTISMTELAGTANQVGHIRICLAAPGWATANAGPLEQAPSFDCSNAADLTRSLDGNWLGDLGALLPNGGTASLGVLLVDDLGLPVSLGATVQISSITITGQSGEPTPATTPTTTAPPVDDSFVEPSPGFVPPPTGSFDVPGLDPATPTAPPAATTSTTAPPPPPLLPAAIDGTPKPWARLAVIAPVSLGAGFAAVFARRRGFAVS